MCPMSNRTAICPLTADRNMLKSIFMPALGFRPSFFLYTCCLHDSFSHLDMLRKLQLDSNDSALCGSKGNLKNILELICNEPAEFNLRLDHGLNEDVREWLTGPVNVL